MPERTFGRTVRYRRTKLGLSQAKLGELVGRSSSTIRSWERDKSAPTETGVLHALAAVLGVDVRSLFEKAGQDPPPDVETSPTVEEALASLRPVSLPEELEEDSEAEEAGEMGEIGVPEEIGAPEEGDDHQETIPFDEEPVAISPTGTDPGAEIEHRDEESAPLPGTSPQPEPTALEPPEQEPGYVAPPEPYVLAPPSPPLLEPSYMEDQSQRQLYRVRNLATLVVVVALLIALLWAVSESLGALGDWWDSFFGEFRL